MSFVGLVAFALAIAVGSVSIFFLFLESRLSKSINKVGSQLKSIESEISSFRSYSKYMRKIERTRYEHRLELLRGPLHFLESYVRLLSAKQRRSLAQYKSEVRDIDVFLQQFVSEYVKREVDRRKDFFGRRNFDKQQIEAIAKTDNYNLIIAGAGSGKTRTLTGRFAFLVESGIPTHDILALAYTRSAAREMEERLRTEYGIADANVRTFHSLGRELLKNSENFRRGVAGDSRQRKIIAESLGRLSNNQAFASHLLDFAVKWQTYEPKPETFPDPEKYYEFLRNQRYTTLDSGEVKSIAERDIANFLILNQVKFEYEKPADWADTSSEFRQYEPDFYLPEYDLWIEHFGIDRSGNVPPWFSRRGGKDPSQRYKEEMEWKRAQFKKHNRNLVETYHYQWAEDSLVDELRRQLQEKVVLLRELSKEAILDHVRKLIPAGDQLNVLMFSFVSKAKTNALTVSEIKARLSTGRWNRSQRAFANLMISIWQEYEDSLRDANMIDFSDMINLTLGLARSENRAIRHFPHILVDEFQDITDPQLELLGHLVTKDPGSTLFCVGDYRQNIFSFAGSDINNILEFEKVFPFAETTNLSTNYRSPKNIVEVSNVVADLNKGKRGNETIPASAVVSPIILNEKDGRFYFPAYEQWELEEAKELLDLLIRTRKPQERILVLARTNYTLKLLKVEYPNSDEIGLRFMTIHRAKGLEADYVVLLNCIKGPFGFPSNVFDNQLLEIVRKKKEMMGEKIEEERRLFYVALTRSRNKLFIFTSKNRKSQFIHEIENYLSYPEVAAETPPSTTEGNSRSSPVSGQSPAISP